MKRILLLFISLAVSALAFAYRGEVIKYNGVVYTVMSEYNLREESYNENTKKTSVECGRYGEVYVSGVTTSNVNLVIKPEIKIKTTRDSKKPVFATFTVVGIGDKAFEGAKLQNLILPNNMRFIGNEAFKNMELSAGIFFLPTAKRIMKDAFDGMKAKLFILDMGGCGFENTFQNKDLIPEIYVPHSHYTLTAPGLDKKLLYTVGDKILAVLLPKDSLRKNMENEVEYLSDKTMFKTLGDNALSPAFNIRKAKRFVKIGSNLDLMAPFEYACFNPATGEQNVYSEFVMNNSIFRVRKDKEYQYFTLDGKPVADVSAYIDSKGQDPFGFQYAADEVRKFKANKPKGKAGKK